ncbi:MAG: Abi family protein [Oceanococcus sp.]|nr:MAG: Abi family protein [Oceanococcus sp.]
MKFNKPALNYQQQIALLKQRGMQIADETSAATALARLNYYRLAAYWYPFYDGDPKNHQFRPGTNLDAVLRIYDFDRRLRLRLVDAIERFEVALRTQFAYVLAHTHGAWAYEDPVLFSDQQKHTGRLGSLDGEIRRSEESFIKHYLQTYTTPQRPPIWVVCEVMSLGLLSGLFDNLKARKDRQAIAGHFGLDEVVLRSLAHHVTVVRNICAHHGRLWNRQFVVTTKLPKKGPVRVMQALEPAAPRKLYNTLVLIADMLLVISDDRNWRAQLIGLIDEYPEADVAAMGFPADWRNRQIWAEVIS